MKYTYVGHSKIGLSAMGVGCWAYGGGEYWGAQSQEDVNAVVSCALDSGANYFDTAEVYNAGASEAALGEALKGRRDKAVIGSKVSTSNVKPTTLRLHCEESLKRLKTDYIDIYMLHWPVNEKSIAHFSNDKALIDEPVTVAEVFETMKTLQKEGKIREIGISNHGVGQMKEVFETSTSIAVNELPYNLISRAIEPEIAPFCVKNNVGILGYMAYQQGVLSGKHESTETIAAPQAHSRHFLQSRGGEFSRHYENGAEDEINVLLCELRKMSDSLGVPVPFITLSWTLANSFISSSIVGCRNVKQLTENIKASEYALPDDVKRTLDTLSAPILTLLGNSPDYYENRKDSRIY